MPSAAAVAFGLAMKRSDTLLRLASDRRLRPQPRANVEAFLHAALAASVAGWEGYVERMVDCFFDAVARSADPQFQALHSTAKLLAARAVAAFNTPNAERSREVLVNYTGFDPWAHWIWARAGLNALETRELLNEVLRVRHSFSHGFPLPKVAWAMSSAGVPRLDVNGVRRAHGLLRFLVRRTDAGMATHLRATYGVKVSW